MLEWLPGQTHLKAQSLEMCQSSGLLVGQFHRALYGRKHRFFHRRLGVHDTAAHLKLESRRCRSIQDHPAYEAVNEMAQPVCELLRKMDNFESFPERICRGSENQQFALRWTQEATALIDLDTLAPMPLAHEMGDALRSWCNSKR